MGVKATGGEKRTCLVTMKITQGTQETWYAVKPIRSDLHVRAYQLRKLDGKEEATVYAVTQEASGRRDCDCGAAIFRDQVCKHLKSLEVAGFLLTNRELLAMQAAQPLEPTRRK
jgi:hypothetical protein